MDSKANVRDLECLTRAKLIVSSARTELIQAVSEAASHATAVLAWVERDGPSRWEAERRRATEALAAAKSALYRRQITPAVDGGKVSDVDERKALTRAQQRLFRVEEALRRLRRLRVEVTREVGLLKAGLGPVSAWIDSDSVRAQAVISRMGEALARYRADEPDIARIARAARDSSSTDAGGGA